MKVHIQRTKVSILLAHDTPAFSVRVKQMEAHANSIARVKAQLLACADKTTRIERVKMLKAQVDAGTYSIDSQALARKIQNLPVMRPLPACEKNGTSLTMDEMEPHE